MIRVRRWRVLIVTVLLIATSIVYLDNPSLFRREDVPLGVIAAGSIRIGETAPDFALKTLDGQVVKLSDFQGQKVLVNFWATWCAPCRAEIPDLEKVHRQGDVVVLGLDLQERIGDIEQFLENDLDENVRVTYTILLDSTGDVANAYNLFAQPSSYLVDTDGTIWARKFGAFTPEELEQRIAEFTRS
ncbi:MAG: TlpA family protein disulfide reductase [Candidatus Bipolaricaulia bacterium]